MYYHGYGSYTGYMSSEWMTVTVLPTPIPAPDPDPEPDTDPDRMIDYGYAASGWKNRMTTQ